MSDQGENKFLPVLVDKPKVGAPSLYTDEIAEKICELISTTSMSLRAISIQVGVSFTTVKAWLRKKDEFRAQYERAKKDQADLLADEMIEIADDSSQDTITIYNRKGEPILIEDKEWVNRSKLRVETRRYVASKLNPKKYGDKIEVSGDKENPLTVQITGMKIQ